MLIIRYIIIRFVLEQHVKKKLKIAIEQRYYSLFFRKGREFLWKMFGTN